MFDQGSTPGVPPPPSVGGGAAPSRYAYLVGRLRARQITMEEATELFSLQQAMIRSTPPPPPSPDDSGRSTSAPSASAIPAGAPLPLDDALWMTLLAMGAGAGLLAAVLKRASDGPKAPSAPPRATDVVRPNG